MKICFIADARSPIARGWIELFRGRHDIVVLSTFPSDSPWEGVRVVDLQWLNWMYKPGEKNKIEKSRWVHALRFLNDLVLLPIKSRVLARQVRRFVKQWRPDLVHALRIPTEGQVAALAGCAPLAVSVWGNDFTLHAPKSSEHRRLTAAAVKAAGALIADCQADLDRARDFGLTDHQISAVLAGGGGIDLTDDLPPPPDIRSQFAIPAGVPLVINPRGARPYVRTDTFLEAVRLVHETDPSIMFLGVGLQGWASAEQYVANHGLEKTLLLTSHLDRATLLGLMRTADISVSLAEHDGTPNTLLEAMYSGSFPICGDLPSIREWITSGKNGILVAPSDARQVAHSILDAMGNLSSRKEAVVMNRELIRTRADRDATREQAETLYRKLAAVDSDASDKGKRNGAAIT